MSGGPLAHEPHDHVVNFYDDDDDVIADVAPFVASGLRAGEGVIVVATAAHRASVDDWLLDEGVDVESARASRQYVCLDAAETLSTFMDGDRPMGDHFDAAIGAVIDGLSARGRPVRAFGEMVALLWDAGNVDGAIELESLWNELSRTRDFTLYCAYRVASLAVADLVAADQICALHSELIPPRSYVSGAPGAAVATPCGEVAELFVPVPASVKAVRRLVFDTLEEWCHPTLIDDACLVASELATNAVRHASSAFEVRLSLPSPTSLRIAVRDVSATPPERCDPEADVVGGRGIAMVERLSSLWGSEAHVAGGKVVWAEVAATGRT